MVLGGGPGGCAAAFRAADLGMEATIVEARGGLGGVCLNEGCIPSKTYLNIVRIKEEAESIKNCGVHFNLDEVDPIKMAAYKNKIVAQLSGGLRGLADKRKVKTIQGFAKFTSPRSALVDGQEIKFEQAVIAVGSRPVSLPGWPEHPRIWNSTQALELSCIPSEMIIAGAGIIGLELACIYSGLGTKVTLIELYKKLIPACDQAAVKILQKSLEKKGCTFLLGTEIKVVSADEKRVVVETSQGEKICAEYMISAVGRCANGDRIDLHNAGLEHTKGVIEADLQGRTAQPHIFAIGDVAGMPMLAHLASHQGKVAAEALAGLDTALNTQLIPAVAYTIPELAWVGYNLEQSEAAGYKAKASVFPWEASGRNIACGGEAGMTKLVYCKETGRILGGTLIGSHAGELLSEITLAIEMGANLEDLSLTIHPHPTFSETLAFSAERALGTLTDL